MKSTTTLKAGVFAFVAVALSACQTDHMVTSLNPLLQSSDARELRQQLSGSTLEYTTEGCISTVEYARNGSTRGQQLCERPGAAPVTATTVGTWTVREDQLCVNTQTHNGERLSRDMQRMEICARIAIDGDSGVLYYDPTPVPFRIIARAG